MVVALHDIVDLAEFAKILVVLSIESVATDAFSIAGQSACALPISITQGNLNNSSVGGGISHVAGPMQLI
jgi:hypothetical protein